MESYDSLKWFHELAIQDLRVTLAPITWSKAERMADLIRQIGPSIAMFYAWQHGKGV